MNDTYWREWMHKRTITDAVIAQYQIRWDSVARQIVIPVTDETGKFLFNKYRRDPLSDEGPKYLYDKGGRTALFGLDQMLDGDKVVITEGEMDALVVSSHNIWAVSSTGGCMSFQKEWAQWFEGREVYVCYDTDEAGGKGIVKTLEVVPHAKVVFLPQDAGVKDISDYYARGGDIVPLLASAKSYAGIADVREDMVQREALWQYTHFHKAYIEDHERKAAALARPKRDTAGASKFGSDIERARAFPIGELLSVGRGSMAHCPFHTDSVPSLKVYEHNNTFYCFGCDKWGSSIDIVMQNKQCGFKEAVQILIA